MVEDRLFVTNLPVGRLDPDQCLTVVRRHWRIENDCYNTLSHPLAGRHRLLAPKG